MIWKRFWPFICLLVIFVGSFYVDNYSNKVSSREPANYSAAKSCKEMIAKFLEKEKQYTLPTYSVATLSYGKSTNEYLVKLKDKSPKNRLQSLIKLNEYRGSSRELTKAYVKLVNEVRVKNLISKNSLKKLIRHTKDHSVPLGHLTSGKVYIPKNSEKKLMGSSDLLEKVLRKKDYSDFDIKKYKKLFLDMTEEELMLVRKSFSHDDDEMRALARFIHYSRTLSDYDRLLALDHAHEIYLETSEKVWVSNFHRERKKFNSFRDKQRKKFLKKQIKTDKKTHSKKALKEADKHAHEVAKLYEKLYYGCRNASSTKVQLEASKTYGKYILTLAPITAGTSYTVVNWDKEKDAKWFKGIAYDITLATFLNYYAGKLLTGPGDGHLKKLAKSIGFYGTVDLATTPLYNYIFSPGEEEREKVLKQLVTDENEKEKLKSFLNFIAEADHDKSVESSLLQLIKKEDGSSVTKEDLKNLSPEDLLSEGTKDEFLELLAAQMYEENKGDWIATGNQGLDRFWFHRTWDVASFPLDLYANMLIFDKLCVTVNPAKAKFEAALIFLGWRAINDAGYYFTRGEAVNQ